MDLALVSLFKNFPLDALVDSMLGLMDPSIRAETWDEEQEEVQRVSCIEGLEEGVSTHD